MASSETSRDEFVRMMISELKKQQEEEVNDEADNLVDFQFKRGLDPLKIFQAMCFDFPNVYEEQVRFLASAISEALDSPTGSLLPVGITVQIKFLHGIEWLSSKGSDDGMQRAISELSVAVFIKLVESVLNSSNRDAISQVLYPLLEHSSNPSETTSEMNTNSTLVANSHVAGNESELQSSSSHADSLAESEFLNGLRGPNQHEMSNRIDENDESDGSQWASEEDPDDFEFEGSFNITNGTTQGSCTEFTEQPKSQHKMMSPSEIRKCLLHICSYINYSNLSGLDSVTWEQKHVSAMLFRITKSLISSSNIAIFQSETQSDEFEVAELRGVWHKLLFVLRDRLIHNPQSSAQVFPVFLQVSSLVPSNIIGEDGSSEFVAMENPVICGALAAIVSSPHFGDAPKPAQQVVWKSLVTHVSSFAKTFDAVATQVRVALGKTRTRRVAQTSAQDTAVTNTQLKSLVDLFLFLSGGDPSQPWSAESAVTRLSSCGIIRTASTLWIDCIDSVLHPSDTKIDSNSSKYVKGASGVIAALGELLATCSWRSEGTATYLCAVPGLLPLLDTDTAVEVIGIPSTVTFALVLAAATQNHASLVTSSLERVQNCFQNYLIAPVSADEKVENAQNISNLESHNSVVQQQSGSHRAEFEAQASTKATIDILQALSVRGFLRCLAKDATLLERLRQICRNFELSLQGVQSRDDSVAESSGLHPKLETSDRQLRVRQLVKRVLGRIEKEAGKGGNKYD